MRTTHTAKSFVAIIVTAVGLISLIYSRDFPTNGMVTHAAFYVELSLLGSSLCYLILLLAEHNRSPRIPMLFGLTAVPALLLGLAAADTLTDLRLEGSKTMVIVGFIVSCLVYALLLAEASPRLNREFHGKPEQDRTLLLKRKPVHMIPTGIILVLGVISSYYVMPEWFQSGMFTYAEFYIELVVLSIGILQLWLGILLTKRLSLWPVVLAAIVPLFFLGCAATDTLKDLLLGSPKSIGWSCIFMLLVCVWQLCDLWWIVRPLNSTKQGATTVAASTTKHSGAIAST